VKRSIAQTINTGTAAVSSKDWKADSYTRQTALTPSIFTQYVKSRKEHQTISDLSSIDKDGIYVWQTGIPFPEITAVPSQFNDFNVLLIVADTVSINMVNFNPTKSIAIIATTINFSSTTTESKGIFIAQTINTGSSSTQGLKITGNLVAFSSFVNGREWPDNSQPSVFIVFDQEQYINLGSRIL